jgi:hypothetical protein
MSGEKRYLHKDFANSFVKLSPDERIKLIGWMSEAPETPFPELSAPRLDPIEKQQMLDFAKKVSIRVKREAEIEENWRNKRSLMNTNLVEIENHLLKPFAEMSKFAIFGN